MLNTATFSWSAGLRRDILRLSNSGTGIYGPQIGILILYGIVHKYSSSGLHAPCYFIFIKKLTIIFSSRKSVTQNVRHLLFNAWNIIHTLCIRVGRLSIKVRSSQPRKCIAINHCLAYFKAFCLLISYSKSFNVLMLIPWIYYGLFYV